ncbi:MAG: ribosomal protein S18-alanine N-acetyltransferase [Ruminococcus sp.]|nr:ribosomal protein S18-alanine N-acetyltransferase [Ruminococcus sp.]
MNADNYREAAQIAAECFSQPWSEKTFCEELSNSNAHTYVAYENGEAAGFLSVWEVCGAVDVNNIAVREKFRRRGIARALIEKMLSELGAVQSITLEVRKSNTAAIALYEGFGFEKAGERRGFYSKPTEDAIIMTKVLNGDS